MLHMLNFIVRLFIFKSTSFRTYPNILDLIFSPDEFVSSIDVTDTVLSEHCIITVKTSIPFCNSPPICQALNCICKAFEPFDFKKAYWSGLCSSIKSVNWQVIIIIIIIFV